jgi:hypothetical protein
MGSYTAFLERALARERRAQRFHVAFTVTVVLAGAALITGVQLAPAEPTSATAKLLLTLGGTFLSSLGALPLKEFFRRGERLAALQFLLDGFRHLADTREDRLHERETALVERFWKVVDTGLEA